jgi:putative acetyltransferase
MTMTLEFRLDDLTSPQTLALIAKHLQGMHASSPPESVHALGAQSLKDPGVELWAAWSGEALAGIGALKALDPTRGELKSMRVADGFLGRGVGRAMLDHLLARARARGFQSVWLETGSTPDFTPAHKLYESAGFTRCGPFGAYTEDPFSVFMTLALRN